MLTPSTNSLKQATLKTLTVAILAALTLPVVAYAQADNDVVQSNTNTPPQVTSMSESAADQALAEDTQTDDLDNEEDMAQAADDAQSDANVEASGLTASESAATQATAQSDAAANAAKDTSLSAMAKQVNSSEWKPGVKMTQAVGTKVQALLNWNQHGVGAVDGYWGKNTQKAMQAFQQAQGLPVTDTLDQKTWEALLKGSGQNDNLGQKPVLISYTLKDSDVNIKTTTIPAGVEAKSKLEGLYYESIPEALGEKFHMSVSYLKQLNPNAKFVTGETLTVYNPGRANTKAISRVVADKNQQTLYAYDKDNKLVASYPTTVGSTATPSPTGTHKVKVKVSDPNYTHTDADGKQTVLPPGPNNPVGRVWIGLDKPSYGIHGSPDPERISRQASAGCIRLTNWDAMALLNTIENGATVEFK